jgi:hypothetical protein
MEKFSKFSLKCSEKRALGAIPNFFGDEQGFDPSELVSNNVI